MNQGLGKGRSWLEMEGGIIRGRLGKREGKLDFFGGGF